MNIIIEMCHFLSIRYVGKKYPTTIKKKKKKTSISSCWCNNKYNQIAIQKFFKKNKKIT